MSGYQKLLRTSILAMSPSAISIFVSSIVVTSTLSETTIVLKPTFWSNTSTAGSSTDHTHAMESPSIASTTMPSLESQQTTTGPLNLQLTSSTALPGSPKWTNATAPAYVNTSTIIGLAGMSSASSVYSWNDTINIGFILYRISGALIDFGLQYTCSTTFFAFKAIGCWRLRKSTTPYPPQVTMTSTQASFAPILPYTIGSQVFSTVITSPFAAPTMMIITTVALRQTAVLQYLSGGAIATPIATHNSNTPAMLTLNPTNFEISSALTMASLRWMGVALAVQDWSQSSMDPAKQIVVAEGFSRFMEEMGSLMGRTTPDDEDDHDDHHKKDDSCTRSSSGLRFIGNVPKTISCIIGTASDISHAFSMLIKGAIDIHTAISTSAVQMAAILDVIKFMADPALNTRLVTPPLSPPSTSNGSHVTESAHVPPSMPFLTTQPNSWPLPSLSPLQSARTLLSNSETSTDTSRSSTLVSSSVSSTMACAVPTSIVSAFPGELYTKKPFCPRFQPCVVSCTTCLQEVYVEGMEGFGGGMIDETYNRSDTLVSIFLAQLDHPESTTEEGINAFMRSKFADAKHACETNNEERVFVPHGHTGT
ncbi:hypothetical protein BKA58DRAFT_453093 [Alternaria rosae]|uniref:uncharacterized protein n=1 Tax=Alternaria rosae TaxID=1187941 RepID=UPI001E8DC85E|nr:uncharacterized protein BKA58DRAFT_453093 [Alternaria rosae]KAH6878864.1 hypothetical protein BKA58DRAFT_453093 [Alternaria rosae]